jgi:hypothetical protein
MLNPGRRMTPSPTPTLRRLASLTVLAMRFRINPMCLTSSSTGTCFDSAPIAPLAALSTVGSSLFNRYDGDLIVKVSFVSACGENMRGVCVSSRLGHLRRALTVSECLSENRNLVIVIPHGTESTGAIALASFKHFSIRKLAI